MFVLFQYSSSSSSATAFPFNTVEPLHDSGTSSTGSVPDTPDVPELKKLKHKKLVTTPTVNITRLPCLPERSTYPVELAESLPLSKYLKI